MRMTDKHETVVSVPPHGWTILPPSPVIGRPTRTNPEEPVLSYNPNRTCPKCEHRGSVRTYSEVDQYVRGGEGALVCVAKFSDPRRPHLVIRCVGCGWEWLSETKDAVTGA